jgi:hypothetical protein
MFTTTVTSNKSVDSSYSHMLFNLFPPPGWWPRSMEGELVSLSCLHLQLSEPVRAALLYRHVRLGSSPAYCLRYKY